MVTLRAGSGPIPPRTRWTKREEVPALLPAGIGTVQTGRPPWEAPGWFPAADRWLHDQLAVPGRSVAGRIEKRRCWELSTVLRAATDAGPVWLKDSAGSSLFANGAQSWPCWRIGFSLRCRPPVAWHDARRSVLLEDLGPKLGWDAPIETPGASASGVSQLVDGLQGDSSSDDFGEDVVGVAVQTKGFGPLLWAAR